MRKSDDDLKIDIADLFGEELPSPSDAIEESSLSRTAPPSQVRPEEKTPAEAESQFKEWMESRNTELETKVRELELRLKELKEQPPPPPPPPAPIEAQAPASPPALSPSEPALAVDFSAPIAPPFMGPAIQDPVAPNETLEGDAPIPGEEDPQKAEDLRKLQADHEFLMLYDEYRNILLHELKDLVGEKKTYTMLERTVEMARGKFPEVFRNANWDTAGNLLEDGSVDSQRIIENKNALEAGKADGVVDAALSTLLTLRLQAVEKGLGAGLRNKIRARMFHWITEKLNRAQKEGKDVSFLKRLGSYVA